MTRPFGLRDLGLLWDLREQGLTLDMQRAVLWKPRPLQTALTGLVPSRHLCSTLTYVYHSEGTDGRGFVQVLTCPERQEWQVIHLAPWRQTEPLARTADWAGVLVDVCAMAREWGALRIRAGVAVGGAEEEAFRQAGFAVYTQEEVYWLRGPLPPRRNDSDLRPVMAEDAWGLLQLVGQVVPPAVQHAEGLTVQGASVPVLTKLGVSRERGYVLEQGTGLVAYVGLSQGAGGVWARILLHPEARRKAASVVSHLVAAAWPVPVLYCAVRDYQSGLRAVLADSGFEAGGVQAWLVKHTARPAEARHFRQLPALRKGKEPVTTPLHPVNDRAAVPCWRLTREHSV